MSDIHKVLAPNGNAYTFHPSVQRLGAVHGLRGFVYVHGRRVYGTLRGSFNPYEFRPVGKWAHLVKAHEYASV